MNEKKTCQSAQTTLVQNVQLKGVGVHSGALSQIDIRPAPVDHGIVFVRRLPDGGFARIEALARHLHTSDLCTTLRKGEAYIETIEHVMAAVRGSGLDNLEIEVSHHEIPILDGSAAPFVQVFTSAGIVKQAAPRSFIRIIKTLRLVHNSSWAEFQPCPAAKEKCHFDIHIDFASQAIGYQQLAFDLDGDFFAREIAPARTFGFLKEAEILRARGLARGASLDNCLVIGEDEQLLNPYSLRFDDEFVRHKALDAIGDTALLGLPFIGIFRSHRPSHQLNAILVKALLASPAHFEIIK